MILYFKKNSTRGPKIAAAIAEVYTKELTAICHSLKDALFSTARSAAFRDIIVLLAEDQLELANLFEYGAQLREHNLILILPSKTTDNLVTGCAYQPKYMADMNGDFKDVQSVIKKMTNV
jgi:hypothetical protein